MAHRASAVRRKGLRASGRTFQQRPQTAFPAGRLWTGARAVVALVYVVVKRIAADGLWGHRCFRHADCITRSSPLIGINERLQIMSCDHTNVLPRP